MDYQPYFDKLLANEIAQAKRFAITPTLGQLLYGAPDPLLADGSPFELVDGVYRRKDGAGRNVMGKTKVIRRDN